MGEQVAARFIWGCSSVGRAPALQAGGQEFDSLRLHAHMLRKKLLRKQLLKEVAQVTSPKDKSQYTRTAHSLFASQKAVA